MEKNIGEYLSRKSTEVIAIVACEQEKAHMVLHSSCLQTK